MEKKAIIIKDYECCLRVVGSNLTSHLLGIGKKNNKSLYSALSF